MSNLEGVPLLSIIIPCFKAARYLPENFRSIAKALGGRNDVEVIYAVNVSEGDDSLAILRGFIGGDPRFKAFSTPRQFKAGKTRYFGAGHAKGKYIGFIDADDTISEDYFDVITPYLEKNDLDLLGFTVSYMTNGKIRKSFMRPRISGDGKKLLSNLLVDLWVRAYSVTKIYRRELLFSSPIPISPMFEDTVFTAVVATRVRRFLVLPNCLYLYHKGLSQSLTAKKDALRYQEHAFAFILLRCYFDANGLDWANRLLRRFKIRSDLSLLYSKWRSKKDGMDPDGAKKAAFVYKAAMDLSKPVFESCPELVKIYEGCLKEAI